jgi:hypothetical protein
VVVDVAAVAAEVCSCGYSCYCSHLAAERLADTDDDVAVDDSWVEEVELGIPPAVDFAADTVVDADEVTFAAAEMVEVLSDYFDTDFAAVVAAAA